MRERCPMAHNEFTGWSLFRHEDVVRVVADPETYSSAARHPAIPNGMDPPEHGQYRDALAPHVSDEQMDALAPPCRQIAADLLGPMIAGGEVDFRDRFGVEPICRTLAIAPSSYYAARSRPPSARALADAELSVDVARGTARSSGCMARASCGGSCDARASWSAVTGWHA